jgi:hypothetical protein
MPSQNSKLDAISVSLHGLGEDLKCVPVQLRRHANTWQTANRWNQAMICVDRPYLSSRSFAVKRTETLRTHDRSIYSRAGRRTRRMHCSDTKNGPLLLNSKRAILRRGTCSEHGEAVCEMHGCFGESIAASRIGINRYSGVLYSMTHLNSEVAS